MKKRRSVRVCILFSFLFGFSIDACPVFADLQVGAAVVDVTPDQLPVLINGGMLSRSADQVKTRVNARAIVMDDGQERIGIVVVDSCMVPRVLLDDAKHRAASRTKLKPDRILVSATHTHTAPSSFGALGTNADPSYVPFLRERIVEALVKAEQRLQPARVGWGVARADEFTALRRWVRRPDRLDDDPFGNPTVRANMHAARSPEDVTGPTGPEDPDLSMIVFESTDGVPIAALANFSMHYFGDQPISADYFGLFCDGLEAFAKTKHAESEMVGIMSHGCSGDIWRRDYMTWKGQDDATIDGYTNGLLKIAQRVFESIEFTDDADLAMAEARLAMDYRVPDQQRLAWSQQIVDAMESDVPKDRTEVYAREQVLLDEMKSTEIVVQAIRIGDIGIATTPNETYALTGLKLKTQSPLRRMMVIELANGADGYIPPPEQHHLGGYNTWAARSAGLETSAEPRIVATNLHLLEQVSGRPRRDRRDSEGPASARLIDANPLAYWRMAEMDASAAKDRSGNHFDGIYEPGVCFYLEGPTAEVATAEVASAEVASAEGATRDEASAASFTAENEVNRCVHFAGGRMRSRLDELGDDYTLSLHFWNGMPNDARATTGWLFSRDHDHAISGHGQHLGIGGTSTQPGRLLFQQGLDKPLQGTTEIPRWSWNRVLLVRQSGRVRVYLNDNPKPEIDVATSALGDATIASCFIGGRSDNDSNFEGRIDEVAVFDGARAELLPQ
ncbi:MAG: LamG-like jellyroll fold domain-containing protein [Rubripirellula sp.]